jgi:hypothetical protein
MGAVIGTTVERRNDRQMLIVDSDDGREEIVLAIWPEATVLPRIVEVLRVMQENTARQFDLLDNPMVTRAQVSQVVTPDLAIVYCVQRADILSHRRMLMVWRDNQPAPSVKRLINNVWVCSMTSSATQYRCSASSPRRLYIGSLREGEHELISSRYT